MKIAGSEAKPVLADLIRRAASGEAIELTRYGNTQAVLIGKEQYDRLTRELMRDK